MPRLSDREIYLASVSTIYRILRQEAMLEHRQKARPATRRPKEKVATGPCQLWSWDIERHEALLNLAVVKDRRLQHVAACWKKLRAA